MFRVSPIKFICSRLLFLLLPLLISCERPSTLLSYDAPEELNNYISAYTSGYISRAGSIKVRFVADQIDASKTGSQASAALLDFSPAISGKLYWETPNTLRFDPEEYLASGKTYTARLSLGKIIPGVSEELQNLSFRLMTQDQFFEVHVEGFESPDPDQPDKTMIRGKISTFDVAEASAVADLLKARQDNKKLNIRWEEGADQKNFPFTIEGIERKDDASLLKLQWEGNALNVDLRGEKTLQIPAKGDFRVMDMQYHKGQDPYLSISFSDPLTENQSFEGLVQISGYNGSLRYIPEGHQLSVIPAGLIQGIQNIRVFPGIKNIRGKSLAHAANWELDFPEAKPELRESGSGTILPDSEGLLFPFEATGLKAVTVEVFKIYNNNILQFLQNNKLGDEGELYRVGKIISRKKVSLPGAEEDSPGDSRKRYSIDLKPLIEKDPTAIYQVRIGFKPEDAINFCENGDTPKSAETVTTDNRDLNDYSIMDYYYGPEGYYDGYSWDDREDPCKPAYYHSGRFISKNILASNLGISAKAGDDQSFFVAVTDLRTAAPLPEVTVTFYDYQQQVIFNGTTDKAGILTARLDAEPYIVTATVGRQKGYLRLEDGESLSLSKFDVSGSYAQQGLKGYLYGDRDVWRPGDSVFLNFVLDDKQEVLPKNYPISFEVLDARGQIFYQKNTSSSQLNIYPLPFATPSDAPTGRWLARVKTGGATFEKVIRIETIKPNRIKIDLDISEATGSAQQSRGKIQASWLQGSPASGLNTNIEYKLKPIKTVFPGFPDFEFDDPARSFTMEPQTIFEGTTDASGFANFSFSTTASGLAPGKMRMSFKTTVFEKGGNFSTDNLQQDYDPYQYYCGLSVPENSYGQKEFEVDREFKVAFTSLNSEGSAIPGRKLSIGLYKLEWRWWWDQDEDYETSRYRSGTHNEALYTTEVTTGSDGKALVPLTTAEWGRYLIRVCDTAGGHCAGTYFYSGSPWEASTDARKAAAQLPISLDKENYATGEEVNLSIQGSEGGKALVTLENGSRVLQYFWKELKEGENTISFKASGEMTPNVYAHISLIQPHAGRSNDLPIRLYGVAPVMVSDPTTVLKPLIKLPEEVKPESSFTIEVSEENKQEMAYTLAIVDEGLLSLTRFRTPDPFKTFYAREALGVRTWDVYDDVLGAYGARLDRLISIGGDGAEIDPVSAQDANRFKPVVVNLGPFLLKKGAKAKHQITLPNYIGSVRVMVVAANKKAYGSAESNIRVKQPLMLLSTLPRVLSPGESFDLPVSIFVQEEGIKSVTSKIVDKNDFFEVVQESSPLTFDQTGEKMAYFKLKVKEKTGIAQIEVSAGGNGFSARENIEIAIRNPNPRVNNIRSELLAEQGAEWNIRTQPFGISGTNSSVLEVSTMPPIDLGKHLSYLLSYPYGCVEQTVSGAFAQLFMDKLLKLDAKQKDQTTRNIMAAINRLKLFQTEAGGFAYWPGGEVADPWGSTYAGHFLLEAKAKGYAVPENLLRNWIRFQETVSRSWLATPIQASAYNKQAHQLEQAYRLFTLALAGEADLASMNRMQQAGNLTVQASWRLAAAYALAGRTEAAENLIREISTEVAEYRELGFTYGSRLRDRAMILESLVIMETVEETKGLIEYISGRLSGSNYLNTQELAYALLAISKFAGQSDVLSERFSFRYTLGNQTADAGSDNPVFQISLNNPENSQAIRVENTSGKPLFVRLIESGTPSVGTEKASAKGVNLKVGYENSSGESINPEILNQGSDFYARITVSNPGETGLDYQNLALTHIVPPGWEIINESQDFTSTMFQSHPSSYKDIRDDRVNLFFDLAAGTSKTFFIRLNASYSGRYYLPAVICSAMYDPGVEARTAGKWVEVRSVETRN